MRIAIYILVVLLAIAMLLCYAMLVIAHDADERAERMARKWIEEHGDIVDNLKADTISAENIIVEGMRDN